MKAEQKQQAKDLYFNSRKTMTEIAEEVGVDQKTIYRWAKNEAWSKFRQAALIAPAIAVDNMFSQLLNLQKHIANRDEDKQFPTLHEAEITRKLTVCITHMNKYLAMGMNMKLKEGFIDFIWDNDVEQAMKLVKYSDEYFYDQKEQYKPQPWHDLLPHEPADKKVQVPDEEIKGQGEEMEDEEDEYSDECTCTDECTCEESDYINPFGSPDEDFDAELDIYEGITDKTLIQQAFPSQDTQKSECPPSGIFGHSGISVRKHPKYIPQPGIENVALPSIHEIWKNELRFERKDTPHTRHHF